jgi:hypothetical protein
MLYTHSFQLHNGSPFTVVLHLNYHIRFDVLAVLSIYVLLIYVLKTLSSQDFKKKCVQTKKSSLF